MFLDWLEFTYLPPEREAIPDLLNDLCHRLPVFGDIMSAAEVLEQKQQHYSDVFGFNDYFRIAYTPTYNNSGVHVTIPAHGLFAFFTQFGYSDCDFESVRDMMKLLKDNYCFCSRVDLAYDDLSMQFLPQYYMKKYSDKLISTRFRKCVYFASEADRGHTFYLGDRKTGKMLRIYDKDYESGGRIPAIRYEIQFNHEFARQLQSILILETINFADLLLNFLRVTSGNCKQRNQSSTDEEWFNWLEIIRETHVARKVTVNKKYKKSSPEALISWMHSIAAAVASVYAMVPVSEFQQIVSESRLTPRHKKLILDYQAHVSLYGEKYDDDLMRFE